MKAMTAPALVEVAAVNPMAAMRALSRMRAAGFALALEDNALVVSPADWNDARLLAAGEVLYADGRMVNRNDRRYLKEHAPPVPDLVPEKVPALSNVIPIDREAYEERAAIMEYDAGLPRGEAEQKALALALALALRSAELQAAGWSPWNATARAESEMLPEWEGKP